MILRGKIQWLFYDENAKETERLVLDAQGEPRLLNVEKPDGIRWSAWRAAAVLFESKGGADEPLGEKTDGMRWSARRAAAVLFGSKGGGDEPLGEGEVK